MDAPKLLRWFNGMSISHPLAALEDAVVLNWWINLELDLSFRDQNVLYITSPE